MPMIFISEAGDDKNSGLSPRRPIHSWRRRLELKTGEDELVIVGNDEATIARLAAEIEAMTSQT